jgi:transposase InsO family protein
MAESARTRGKSSCLTIHPTPAIPKFGRDKTPHPRYPDLVKNLQINYPEQVWVSGITYIRLEHEFVYLAISLDVFTRAIRGWYLSRTLDQELTLTALRAALGDRQKCPVLWFHHISHIIGLSKSSLWQPLYSLPTCLFSPAKRGWASRARMMIDILHLDEKKE